MVYFFVITPYEAADRATEVDAARPDEEVVLLTELRDLLAPSAPQQL